MSFAKFYEPTSSTPFLNMLTFIGISIVVVNLWAFSYGIINAFFPIVQLTPFITLFFGISVGFSLKFLSKILLIRCKKFLILSGVLFGLLGVYFSWFAFINYNLYTTYADEVYFRDFQMFFNPFMFSDVVNEMNYYGTIVLYSDMISDISLRGNILTTIWIIEAMIIIGLPFYILLQHQITPFSTNHNKWYRKYTLKKEFDTLPNPNDLIEATNLSIFIDQLKPREATRSGRVSIYYLKGETDQYLMFENIHRGINSLKEEATIKVNCLRVSSETAQELIEKYHAKKDFFFDY